MSTFHIWTLGCQMNQADSLKLAAGLEQIGYRAVEDDARDRGGADGSRAFSRLLRRQKQQRRAEDGEHDWSLAAYSVLSRRSSAGPGG